MPEGGGTQDTTVTVWLHVLVLPQRSVAVQVRVMICGQTPLVTVVKVSVTLVPLQMSLAMGASKLQAVPQGKVLLVAQVMTGGVVSTVQVMTWVQVLLLPQLSTAV
jgi:hypothetical protein